MFDEAWLRSLGYTITDGIARRDPLVPVTVRLTSAPRHDHEAQEQMALLTWVGVVLPQEPRLFWLYHIPNGEARSKAAGGKLKALGTKAGVPDLHLPVPSRDYHGMFLELKAPGRQPSPAQQHWLTGLEAQGSHVGVYTSWLAAASALCWYLDRADLASSLEGRTP
jgi:hypothetical protein